MPWKGRHTSISRQQTQLLRTLYLAFGFFFIFPAVGFTLFNLRYNALGHEYAPYFFLGLLVVSWMGFASIHGVASRRTNAEELKTVTLLTIDIRGFFHLAKTMGPRQTVRLLNRFFAATGEVVFRHHGMVDKYLGDGFLAVFGATASSRNDADHAVQSALEMRRCLVDLNRCLRTDFGATIQMGISLHTGEVVVGDIGFEKKMDCTVIGDAVNTVFRMQGLARAFPNGILVSATTLGAVRGRFRVRVADPPHPACHDLDKLAVYELLEHQTDSDDRVVAADQEFGRTASSSTARRKPSPKLPPPVLSP